MRLNVALQQKQTLQMKLAPQMIQAIEILQLPNLDLKDRIDLELAENEVLEVDDRAATAVDERLEKRADAAEVDQPRDDGSGDGNDGLDTGADPEIADTIERLTSFREEDRALGVGRSRAAGQEASDRKLEALHATAAPPPTLQDSVADQLTLSEADGVVAVVARAIAYSLDDDGYLPTHPLARAILAATDATGRLTAPLESVVPDLQGADPLVASDPGRNGRGAPAPVADRWGGGWGAASRPAPARRLSPEEAEEERRKRREEHEKRERARREAADVAATAASLRRRAAREDLEVDLDDAVRLFPLVEVLDLLETEGVEATLDEAERALRLVQRCEPRGIAGRDMAETLILQLDRDDPRRGLKRHVIAHHLEDWRKNRLPRIAQAMDLTMDDLKSLLASMGTLKVHPGADLRSEASPYVHPDVVIEWSEEDSETGFDIRLVNEYFPTLRISTEYLRLFHDESTDPAMREMIKKKIGSARWLIDAIRQRQDTLMRVVTEIVRHQREYLVHGIAAMRPLKMQRIADDLGIHVSTVSRAIADKWCQCPQGILPLKFFFHGGTASSDGSVESRLTVKDRVRQVIEEEDRTKPLSDEDVAKALKADGLSIARRTVTKYRKQLGIPSSRERREWT